MARSLRERGQIDPIVLDVSNQKEIEQVLKVTLRPDDILVTQGAGNVGQLCVALAENGLYLA